MAGGSYLLFTDASVESGQGFIGAVVKQHRNGRLKIVGGISRKVGAADQDVGQAEYRALVEGLKLARKLALKNEVHKIRVFLDRESLVDQINRQDPNCQAALDLLKPFTDRAVSWLPREVNNDAHALAAVARASVP